MKRIYASALLSMALCVCSAQAETLAFGGVRYQDAVKLSVGVAEHLTGSLWTFNYVDLGHYSALNTELALITGLDDAGDGGSWAGLVAGPNADFGAESPDGSRSPLNYLTGAAGFVGGIWFTPKIGAWGYAKYKVELRDAVTYENGVQGGLGISVNF